MGWVSEGWDRNQAGPVEDLAGWPLELSWKVEKGYKHFYGEIQFIIFITGYTVSSIAYANIMPIMRFAKNGVLNKQEHRIFSESGRAEQINLTPKPLRCHLAWYF